MERDTTSAFWKIIKFVHMKMYELLHKAEFKRNR